MLAVTAAGLAVVCESWTHVARCKGDRQLIFRGEQFLTAIVRHRRAIPSRSEWPKGLNALVEDRREDETQHHLRRGFEDPFGPSEDWAETRDMEGGLIGVHSRSSLPPLSRRPREATQSGAARKLSDWRFVVAEAIDVDAPPDAAEPARGTAPQTETPR